MNQKLNIPVRLHFSQGKDQIRFANQFAFSQLEMDVVMDIGVVDPQQVMELNQKIQTGAVRTSDVLEATIFQRVGMSLSTFVKFKQQIDQIFENMEKQGVLVKKPGQDLVQ